MKKFNCLKCYRIQKLGDRKYYCPFFDAQPCLIGYHSVPTFDISNCDIICHPISVKRVPINENDLESLLKNKGKTVPTSSVKQTIASKEELTPEQEELIGKLRKLAYNISKYTNNKLRKYTGYVYIASFYDDDECYQKLSDECNKIEANAFGLSYQLNKFWTNKNNSKLRKIVAKKLYKNYVFLKNYIFNELKNISKELEKCSAEHILIITSTEALTKVGLLPEHHTTLKAFEDIDNFVDKEREFMSKIYLLKNLKAQLENIWNDVLNTIKLQINEINNKHISF